MNDKGPYKRHTEETYKEKRSAYKDESRNRRSVVTAKDCQELPETKDYRLESLEGAWLCREAP